MCSVIFFFSRGDVWNRSPRGDAFPFEPPPPLCHPRACATLSPLALLFSEAQMLQIKSERTFRAEAWEEPGNKCSSFFSPFFFFKAAAYYRFMQILGKINLFSSFCAVCCREWWVFAYKCAVWRWEFGQNITSFLFLKRCSFPFGQQMSLYLKEWGKEALDRN